MNKAPSILDLDNSVVRVFDIERKEAICQFSTKHKLANTMGVHLQTVKNIVARSGKMFVERDNIWLALRLRTIDDKLPTDPSIIQFQKIIASQKLKAIPA